MSPLLRRCAIGVAVLFAAFVWPTLYRYETISGEVKGGSASIKTETLVRVNRITGAREILATSGQRRSQEGRPLTSDQLRLIEVQAYEISDGWFKCELFNGSEHPLESCLIRVTVRARAGGIVFVRDVHAPLYGLRPGAGRGIDQRLGVRGRAEGAITGVRPNPFLYTVTCEVIEAKVHK